MKANLMNRSDEQPRAEEKKKEESIFINVVKCSRKSRRLKLSESAA